MKELIKKRSNNIKKIIKYNKQGYPTRDEARHLASSDGLRVQRMVPVNIDKWHHVPKDILKPNVGKQI